MICDLAETYHILDYRQLEPVLVATLMAGLPDTARLKLKYGSSRINFDRLLLAAVLDGVHILSWMQSKDGMHGRHRPESVVKSLISGGQKKEEIQTFRSGADFERERARLLARVTNGN